MESQELSEMATAEHLAQAVRKRRPKKGDHGHHPGAAAESVREAVYKGHTIRVTTTYRIEVDGIPVEGHVMVNNGGLVHYHGIPNQEFPSAIDLVKRVVDLAGDDLSAPSADHHPGHPVGGM